MASLLVRCAYLCGVLALVCCVRHESVTNVTPVNTPSFIWRSALTRAAQGGQPASLSVDSGAVWVSAANSATILDLRTGATRWRIREPVKIVSSVGRDIIALRGSSLVRYGSQGQIERQVALCPHKDSGLTVDLTPTVVAAYCPGDRRFTIRNARTFVEEYAETINARTVGISKLSDWGFALTRFAALPASHETFVYRRAENRLRSIGRAAVVATSRNGALLLNPLGDDDGHAAKRYQIVTLPARNENAEPGRTISCPRADGNFIFAFALNNDVLYLTDTLHHDLYAVRVRGYAPARRVRVFNGTFDRVIAVAGSKALIQTTAGDLFVVSQRDGALLASDLGRAALPNGVRGISTGSVALVTSESPGVTIVADLQTGKRFETTAKLVSATPAGAGRVALLAISASGALEAMLAQEQR